MNNLGNCLKSVDSVKVPISLTLYNKTSVGSKFGGILSLIGFAFVGVFFISELYNLVWEPKFN